MKHWFSRVFKPRLTRRRSLGLGLASLAGLGAAQIARAIMHSKPTQSFSPVERTPFWAVEDRPLKERAAAKGLLYGAAALQRKLAANAAFSRRFVQECRVLVPENDFKWDHLRPAPDRYDFTQSDWLAEFAHTHDLLLRGHTLVWFKALPNWFEATVNRENAEQFLVEHIATVAGRYAGQIHSWDVVNEAIAPEHGQPNGLRNTPWLNLLGADYIDLAFQTAAAADPHALLVYNDYDLEYDTPEQAQRREAVLNLLDRLKQQGTPIHALGIQSHLRHYQHSFRPETLQTFLADVASLGLKILITELDVIDQHLPADVAIRDRRVAEAYEEYLSVVLDNPAVIAVLTWGLSDRYTWLSQFTPRPDGLPVRPLPLDRDLNRKLAWHAIARCFDQTAAREPGHS